MRSAGMQILSTGAPRRAAVDFNDVLKYGSKMADPNFKPGAKTEARSTITYNPYSMKDYRNIKNSDMNPRNRELPRGTGPAWDEKRAEAARQKED